MKRLSGINKTEKALLLKAIASGKVDPTKINDETIFCFDRREARNEANVINLGEAGKEKFVTVTLDPENALSPFKCELTGVNYSFKEIQFKNENTKFIFVGDDTANKYLECLEIRYGSSTDKDDFLTVQKLKLKHEKNKRL